VARLEAAEHNPTMDTLVAMSRTLGLRVHVDVGPKTGVVAKVTKARAACNTPSAQAATPVSSPTRWVTHRDPHHGVLAHHPKQYPPLRAAV
jgi:hypothetical protein